MIWLDLALGSLLIWGAISGYHSGWKAAACRWGGLLCAVLAALPAAVGLKLLWTRYLPVEDAIRAAVDLRLALPVSAGVGGGVPWGLPCFLWEALHGGFSHAAAAGGGLPADLLAQALGCTAAFLSGFILWWGFFTLLGDTPVGEGERKPKQSSCWGGALIGLARQCCSAALFTGLAAPLAWLCGVPPHLLQLEKTLLARWAWQLFGCLGIWH